MNSEDFIEVGASNWLLGFSNLSALTPKSDSRFLLLKPVRNHNTHIYSFKISSKHDKLTKSVIICKLIKFLDSVYFK